MKSFILANNGTTTNTYKYSKDVLNYWEQVKTEREQNEQ